MVIKQALSKLIFGFRTKDNTDVEIVDGVVIEPDKQQDIGRLHYCCSIYCTPANQCNLVDEWLAGTKTEIFRLHLQTMGKKRRTINEYIYDVNGFVKIADLRRITMDQIELALKGVGTSAAKRKLASLRVYARWLLSLGYSDLFLKTSLIKIIDEE